MQGLEYMYELFETMPRGGPGDNDSTRRAFQSLPPLPDRPVILDIGCGQGIQTIELANISDGRIIALDNHEPFLDILMQTARNEHLLEKIEPKNMSMLDMDFSDESFDLIWSEGALYFMGLQNALQKCYHLLKRKGCLAFTEMVYLVDDPPTPLREYFNQEYPDIASVNDKLALINQAGFELLDHFTLPKIAWRKNYYTPMEEGLNRLAKQYEDNTTALGVFAEMRREIDMYKHYGDYYGYEFFVLQKPAQ